MRIPLSFAAAATSLALGMTAAGCRRAEPGDDITWSGASPAPAAAGLSAGTGQPFRLEDERGKVVALSFGYTSCLEVCPDTFRKARQIFASLGSSSSDVLFVYVTVDPERDTPAVLGPFLAAIDPRFVGLYLEPSQLSQLLSDWHITARKRLPDPTGYARRQVNPAAYYTMDHTSGFWLVDRQGRLRVIYGHDAAAQAITAGVRRLLDEPT